MCLSMGKSEKPAPPPPPPAAPPVLEQEAPAQASTIDSGESDINKKAQGTAAYKNEKKKKKGNSGAGLGKIKKKTVTTYF